MSMKNLGVGMQREIRLRDKLEAFSDYEESMYVSNLDNYWNSIIKININFQYHENCSLELYSKMK